jgi:flagellar basal body P-ring protein FlgI
MLRTATFGIALAVAASGARAARIGDVTHLQGRRVNTLTGLGLVTGLKGTGDGGDFAPRSARWQPSCAKCRTRCLHWMNWAT